MFDGAYRGRRVLLTGHTGFKGSWLAQWLEDLGAVVTGVGLDPGTKPDHWTSLKLAAVDCRLDIRDADALKKLVVQVRPEIVFHLAAQALVRRSYRDPLETWSTNVMGTANLLDACRQTDSVRAIVAVTTDKCYENREWVWGYRENDRLGGHDPYAASKAGSELVAASYREAYFSFPDAPLLATARAGNVIGGGDWSEDRLIPDLVRSLESGLPLEIRSPSATRPWQHVLEVLNGYLMLGQKLFSGQQEYAQAWNFGPDPASHCTVAEVLARLSAHWPQICWTQAAQVQPHESTLLSLDSAKALSILKWHPVWGLDGALTATADWYRQWLAGRNIITRDQIAAYVTAAKMNSRVIP